MNHLSATKIAQQWKRTSSILQTLNQ